MRLAFVRFAVPAMALTAGCAGDNAPPPGRTRLKQGRAADAGRLVGRKDDPWIETQARIRAGANRIRRVLPGQMMTMDYETRRLNVFVDASGRISRFTCG